MVSGRAVANHAEIFSEMVAAGAAILVGNEAELAAQLAGPMTDPGHRDAMAAASAAYAARQVGELATAQALLRPLLPAA